MAIITPLNFGTIMNVTAKLAAICIVATFIFNSDLHAQRQTQNPSSMSQISAKSKTNDIAFTIPFGSRGRGQHEMGNEVRQTNIGELRIPKSSLQTVSLFDAQYQKQTTYLGTWLNEHLLSIAPMDKDTALLHFDNGMLIPLSKEEIAKGRNNKDYGLFLAERKLRRDRRGKLRSLRHFPPVARQDEIYRDPRPIIFSSNKLVVGDALSGGMEALQKWDFSPWYHPSSLARIEWVNIHAYERQFAVAKGATAGLEVYVKRCMYCHTVKMVGATYGWDFVHPTPIYKMRRIDNLFYFVKYPKYDAIRQGLHMPHQPDFTKEEANELWQWLKSVSDSPLKPYAP